MHSLIDQLSSSGELRIVDRQVDPRYQLAALTKAAQAESDAALLFRNVKGTEFPVITNLYCGRKRMSNLIGAAEDGFCPRWNNLLDQAATTNYTNTEPGNWPESRESGRLSDLPLITYHEKDAGPYFTSGIFLARHPDTGVENLSFHRAMYVSDDELRIRLGDSHDLTAYQRLAESVNEPLEVAMLISVDPSIFLAAGASLPLNWSELAMAECIQGAPIETHPGKTVSLAIPANAQIVVEGRILPGERRREGPFGEFMGYYVPEGRNHVFEISAVYWWPQATLHSILCGSREDISLLEALTAAKTYRHLNSVLPGIVDVSCNPSVMNTTIKINSQYEGHARQVLLAAFGAHLDYNKVCAVVDADDDMTDWNEIIWAFATRGRPDRRVLIVDDVPGFYRDEHRDHWGRLGIDATRPFGREQEFERKRIPGEAEINLQDFLQ